MAHLTLRLSCNVHGCATGMWIMGVTHTTVCDVKSIHAMVTRIIILCDIEAKLLFPETCFGKPNDTLTVNSKGGQGGSWGSAVGDQQGQVQMAITKSSRILTPNDRAAKLQAGLFSYRLYVA